MPRRLLLQHDDDHATVVSAHAHPHSPPKEAIDVVVGVPHGLVVHLNLVDDALL
jgi:hypothetical protein